MKKKFLALIMTGIMLTLTASPVFGMSILDSTIHAGAGSINNSSGTGGAGSTAPEAAKTEEPEAAGVGCSVPTASAGNGSGKINEGIYAGKTDLSGLSESEAMTAVNNKVTALGNTELTLNCVSGNQVTVKLSDLGLHWDNTEIIADAVSLGQSGNVIKRFKEMSDLKRTKKVYPLELKIDEQKARNIISDECVKYDIEAEDALMSRSNGNFEITAGQDGQTVNVESSVEKIASYISSDFTGEPASIDLVIDVVKPKGNAETLRRLTDVLGKFTTRFYSSGKDRVTNVTNGCRLINGTLMYPGDQISVSQTISPMTEENGYALAGSYLNGKVVESFGGGICQVSTTLYQAVLRAELQVDERYNHSMVVNYVDHSMDAAIAEGIKDFKFTNNLDNPIYIDGYTTPDKTITFTIYGVETRPSNRTLEFESVDLEENEPVGERIVADSSMAAGSTRKQSAHIGYRSELYKIVKVDGEEKERIKVNSSTYQAVPAILTVGTATSDPNVKAIIESAIATQDIDYCKAIISGQAAPVATTAETDALLALAAAAQAGAAQQAATEDPPD